MTEKLQISIACLLHQCKRFGNATVLAGGGGGFARLISVDGGADQLREVPIIGILPIDGTRGPEVRGYGRIWPDANGPVQGSRARDVKDSVILNSEPHEGVSGRPTLWR